MDWRSDTICTPTDHTISGITGREWIHICYFSETNRQSARKVNSNAASKLELGGGIFNVRCKHLNRPL